MSFIRRRQLSLQIADFLRQRFHMITGRAQLILQNSVGVSANMTLITI